MLKSNKLIKLIILFLCYWECIILCTTGKVLDIITCYTSHVVCHPPTYKRYDTGLYVVSDFLLG